MAAKTFDSLFTDTWQVNKDEYHNPRIILREAEVISAIDPITGCELIIFGKKWVRQRVKEAEKAGEQVIYPKWLQVSVEFNSRDFPTLLMLVSAVRGKHDLSRKMLATICEAMAG
jgi:hypothetical protein